MSELTLDEAIKHCLEVAENNEQFASGKWIGSEGEANRQECEQCAADHRQLAAWLGELKEAKRLLKATTSDIHDMLTERFGVICEFCKWYDSKNADCAKPRNGSGAWCCEYGCSRYADEVKELIGETNEP